MVQRRFAPGGDWIYYKIYAGPKTMETIFIYDIMNVVNMLIKKNMIQSYFFIRYMDPNYHIRLRINCPNADNYGHVLSLIYKKLNSYIKDLIITKVELDTYSRELERYGYSGIVFFEKIFYYDSCFIYRCLKKIDCTDLQRSSITMSFIDSIMDCCNFTIEEKILFTENMSNAYFNEIYQANGTVSKKLNLKYREMRGEIEKNLGTYDKSHWWHNEVILYMHLISKNSKHNLNILRKELPSVIHMHVNRMYRTNQRLVELIIYWCLNKYYKSQKAIKFYKMKD